VVVVEGSMSVINKMLQDLDRRQALGSAADANNMVRAPSARSGGHEWFWRILVVLLAAALGWVGWVAWQLMPRKPLTTELALQVAAEARTRPKPAAAVQEKPIEVTVQQKPVEATVQEKPVEATPSPAPEPVRFAAPPETPVRKIDKRVRTPAAESKAEAHFRRATQLLSRERASEAEGEFLAALRADPAHTAAREAYVAMLLEQQRVASARRVLQEGLALNPEESGFAIAQARIHTAQREYGSALEVLDRAGAANGDAEFQATRAAALQRLGRHAEAIEAYQNALRGAAQPATTWIGLGISLEALGRRSDALLAYRRALNARPLAAEARDYAESRARALE
jgi:MSHA biogenesis protein MshN